MMYFVSQFLVIILFFILFTLQILVFYKLKLSSFDTSAIIIMLSFTICLGTKMINLIIYNYNSNGISDPEKISYHIMDSVNMLNDIVIWGIIFYFIYKMSSVREILTSKNQEEY